MKLLEVYAKVINEASIAQLQSQFCKIQTKSHKKILTKSKMLQVEKELTLLG